MKNWLNLTYKAVVSRGRSLLIPILFALFGSLFLYKEMSSYKKKLGHNMETQLVLVSTKEMPQGHVIQGQDFDVTPMPKKYLPIGVLYSTDAAKASGHSVIRPISRGEMVLWSALDVSFVPNNGPSQLVTKGYRAISISVDQTTSVSQTIQPGDHVDICVTLSMPGAEIPTTITLLQNVSVLRVGTHMIEDEVDKDYSTVSLMVLPKEVPILIHAQQHGKLSFALRHPEDFATSENLPVVALQQVVETAFRSSIQKERNQLVEIIRGGKLEFGQ